jgi:FtsZ-binding cell division protein ZapB
MNTRTIDDLAAMIEKLTGTISVFQNEVESLKKDKASSASPSSSDGNDDQHHLDRPPRFQKIDFPRFDGKSDPMLFVNRCESYFHQQRIMEEKVWMASYHLEGVA